MFLILALVLFLLFAGLGFMVHVLWLGLIAVALVLVVHMVHQGLTRGTPTSRLNVRLLAAARGFLDDILDSRTRAGRAQTTAAVARRETRGSATRRAVRTARGQDPGGAGGAEVFDDQLLEDPLADADLTTEDLDEAEVVDAEIVEETVTHARWQDAKTKATSAEADDSPNRAVAQPVMTPAKLAKAEQLENQGLPRTEIARRLGVSRSTLYRHLAERKAARAARARLKA